MLFLYNSEESHKLSKDSPFTEVLRMFHHSSPVASTIKIAKCILVMTNSFNPLDLVYGNSLFSETLLKNILRPFTLELQNICV